jgi:hypothetical protein
MENCKYCGTKIDILNIGYLKVLDDSEMTRMKELGLNRNENICIECKKELLISGIIAVI